MELCVVSMSGGLDSTTLAMKAIEDGYKIQPINILYGQKNKIEMIAFQNISNFFKKNFPDQFQEPVIINLQEVLNTSINLWEKLRDSGQMKQATDMEFYTPSRNLVFSTLAAMIGEIATVATGGTSLKVGLGIHKHTQYDRDYWDITPEFVNRLNYLFELNDCVKVEMYAPYANLEKSEIVKDAIRLGVPWELTWTCYNPQKDGDSYKPCLECEACIERQNAGDKAGVPEINQYSLKG